MSLTFTFSFQVALPYKTIHDIHAMISISTNGPIKRHAQVPIQRLNSAVEIVSQSIYRCHLVKLEARITQRPLQGMRREKCMLRNPMNHRYQTRHHSLLISSWLGVTHGRTVKIDQAVA